MTPRKCPPYLRLLPPPKANGYPRGLRPRGSPDSEPPPPAPAPSVPPPRLALETPAPSSALVEWKEAA